MAARDAGTSGRGRTAQVSSQLGSPSQNGHLAAGPPGKVTLNSSSCCFLYCTSYNNSIYLTGLFEKLDRITFVPSREVGTTEDFPLRDVGSIQGGDALKP